MLITSIDCESHMAYIHFSVQNGWLKLIGNYVILFIQRSYHMCKILFNFSNPTPDPVPSPGDGPDVTWDLLTPNDLNYLWLGHLGEEVEMRKNYRQQEYSFYHYYYPYVAFGEDMPFEHAAGKVVINIGFSMFCYTQQIVSCSHLVITSISTMTLTLYYDIQTVNMRF